MLFRRRVKMNNFACVHFRFHLVSSAAVIRSI